MAQIGQGTTQNRPAYVSFELRAIEKQRPREEGGAIFISEEEWVKVTQAGSKDIVEKKVQDWFDTLKLRVNSQMEDPAILAYYEQAYAAWKQNKELPLEGTPIKGWPLATAGQQQLCLSINLRTVEDVANANAEAIAKLGIGGQTLRNRAVDFLTAKNDTGPLVTQIEALRATNTEMLGRLKRLEDENRVLMGMKGVETAVPLAPATNEPQFPVVTLPKGPSMDRIDSALDRILEQEAAQMPEFQQ